MLGLIVATLIVCLTVLLIARIYFNSMEIAAASDECLNNNGIVQVDKSFLSLTYSLSCTIK